MKIQWTNGETVMNIITEEGKLCVLFLPYADMWPPCSITTDWVAIEYIVKSLLFFPIFVQMGVSLCSVLPCSVLSFFLSFENQDEDFKINWSESRNTTSESCVFVGNNFTNYSLGCTYLAMSRKCWLCFYDPISLLLCFWYRIMCFCLLIISG